MDISVITVTWNNSEHIIRQIKSVQKADQGIAIEQFVVDNGSKDDTCNLVREKAQEVTLIANESNLGFGAANNQAVAKAKGKYLLFLNPDMLLEEGSLKKIYDWMEANVNVGIASPKLVDENGKINEDAMPRRFPKTWEQVALILKLPHLFPSIMNGYLMKGFDAEKEQEVDSVRGSFMLMRREFVNKLGWAFDPRYFIWYEDVDICKEAYKNGYKVVYTPIITATDYIGQSFKKRTSLWKQKNFTASMLTYFRKWHSPFSAWLISVTRQVGILMVWASEKVRKN